MLYRCGILPEFLYDLYIRSKVYIKTFHTVYMYKFLYFWSMRSISGHAGCLPSTVDTITFWNPKGR